MCPSSDIFAQQAQLDSLTIKFGWYNQVVHEKLFVHTDRNFYLTGETMWFKVYAVDGNFHRPADLSKVAYLEILDIENKPALQTKLIMAEGRGTGTFFLPTSLVSGNYRLRAYTRWMRNFSPEAYFQQDITVLNPFSKLGLKPQVGKPQYDVQFFPEGGHLVNGLESTVGFRAAASTGIGIDFHGSVIDEKNDTIVRFRPLKFGIGRFRFTPVSTHQYKAIIRDTKGNISSVALPRIESSGYVMQVRDTTDNRLSITITTQLDAQVSRKPFIYFLAHSHQSTPAAHLHFIDHGKVTFLVDKRLLGEGVSHLTVFDDDMTPVCERLHFNEPAVPVTIDALTDQRIYPPRKKINLDLFAHVSSGHPEQMDLSVSVYKMDSLQTDPANIVNYLSLTSDLKGNVESPGYYLAEGNKDRTAIDNLMITHGWSSFRWEDILKKQAAIPEFAPEYNGLIIPGQILRKDSGAPAKGVLAFLSTPGKNIRLYLSRSKDEGKVQFEVKDFVGSRKVIVQTNYLTDTTYRIELPSPYSAQFSSARVNGFDVSEKVKDAISARSFDMQIQNAFYDENPNHIAVPIIDSVAFYGKPDETYLLDDYTRFPTMEEVMREYVPGVMVRIHHGKFNFMTLDRPNKSLFHDNPMVLLDGMPVFDVDRIMRHDPKKIKKLDVLTQKYILGPLSFDGLVSYTTYRGDLGDFEPDANALVTKYDGVQWTREFYTPRYDFPQQEESRIPDLRNLLHWSPNVKTDPTGKIHLDFYSSDTAGTYKVVIQGISFTGKPGATSINFTVTENERN